MEGDRVAPVVSGVAIREKLFEIERHRRSVTLDVNDPVGGSLGTVVMFEGKVAWASAKGQARTLLDVLLDHGYVTQEEAAQVTETYRAHQGHKKIGQILEELKLVHAARWSELVTLQIRRAIEALLAEKEVRISFGAPPVIDREVLFTLKELGLKEV